METATTYTAFDGSQVFAKGSLTEVVKKIKTAIGKSANNSILIFSDTTGRTMDFNFQGSEKDVSKRLEVYVAEEPSVVPAGPGRPKIGVVSREVSLQPRHWEWLATQSGGASATLRLLVEHAKKKGEGTLNTKQAQERTYKFMSVMGGDLPGYEEALRALYKSDEKTFASHISKWPEDIRTFTEQLAESVFAR